jgi:hypothetical protein
MDLAYGEYHPSSLTLDQPKAKESDLKGLVYRAKQLLEEADCAQHSVTATIAHLQKHPDAMAAVALTLAEISNIVSKMAPGALATLKGSAPAVFALLASPQFMIAAGVGLGVTIVMFGGYKIIKRIKAANDAKQGSMVEMMELNSDISNVESWRRGVAEYSASSVGTSVDGEFITPTAAAMSGVFLPDRVRDIRESETVRRSNGGDRRRDRNTASKASSRSVRSSRSSKASTVVEDKEKKTKKKEDKDKNKKKKKMSPLRLMFK